MTFGLEVMGMVVIFVVVPVSRGNAMTPSDLDKSHRHVDGVGVRRSPETMLLLMIFPPRVARDLGTTVMMLPLVVLT